MKCVFAIFLFLALLFLLALALYFYFAITIISIAVIAFITIIASMVWACRTHELNEVIDPIRERYRMSIIASKTKGLYENIEEAAATLNLDLSWAKNQIHRENPYFRRAGFVESLPNWIVKQAFPFLAVSAPKWIIAIIIGVLIIQFHEDIIPHGKEEQVQSDPIEVTLQIRMSGDIQNGGGKLDSTIDIRNYCMSAHSNSNVIALSNHGCN